MCRERARWSNRQNEVHYGHIVAYSPVLCAGGRGSVPQRFTDDDVANAYVTKMLSYRELNPLTCLMLSGASGSRAASAPGEDENHQIQPVTIN